MDFLRFIEQTNAAKNKEEAFDLYLAALQSFGLDRIVYSYMTDHPLLDKNAEHGVIRNYPDEWMRHYAANKYTEKDPVYLNAPQFTRPFTWAQLEERVPLAQQQQKVMDEARESGLLDGVAMSIHGTFNECVGIGMASSHGGVEYNNNVLSLLYALTNQFHLVHTDFALREALPQGVQLTQREREILLWSARGKSNTVIADILSITSHTVDFHLRNIFKKLGTNTKILATLKAIRLGLIRP